MAEPAEVSLPATLCQAVRTEFVRALRPPFESLVTVAVNGALMSSSWFLLPAELKDEVFTLHGTLAFALVLAAWMYSDVPATNLLGPDSRRVTATIDDPVALRRLLSAKSIFLWLVVTPVCLVVALVTGIFTHDPLATLYTVIWIGVVPFGVLSITAWVGILYPYHPMPLRYRWEHRRPRWRMLGRWITLVVAPYGLVPCWLWPSWRRRSSCGVSRRHTVLRGSCPTTTSDGVSPWPARWRPWPPSAAAG